MTVTPFVSADCAAGLTRPRHLVALTAAAAAPATPAGLTGSVAGSTVLLVWTAPGGADAPSSYVVEAGSSSGLSNLANFDTGSTAISLTATAVPAETYFVRVRARNSAGASAPSNEITVTVSDGTPACTTAPGAPTNLSATVTDTSVRLTWNAPAGACAATGYVLEAGSSSGLSDLADFNTGTTAMSFSADGVSPGTYFIRVHAKNAYGQSGASNEATVVVQNQAPPPPPPPASAVITITASGVSPETLTISPGTQVTFINNDSRDHEMTSDPHPEHDQCPEINAVGFLVPGQQKQTGNLNNIRSCGFHDHLNNLNSSLWGTITIR